MINEKKIPAAPDYICCNVMKPSQIRRPGANGLFFLLLSYVSNFFQLNNWASGLLLLMPFIWFLRLLSSFSIFQGQWDNSFQKRNEQTSQLCICWTAVGDAQQNIKLESYYSTISSPLFRWDIQTQKKKRHINVATELWVDKHS